MASGTFIPQISYWSSSKYPEDKALYPYFLRTTPSDSAVAYSAAVLFEQLGYTAVGVLCVSDGHGLSYSEAYESFAASRTPAIATALAHFILYHGRPGQH